MNVCVCLCVCAFVCQCTHLQSYTPALHQISVHVICGRGSVLLWRRSDMLCTSGFMDDVIFAHTPTLLDVATRLSRRADAALGMAVKCAQ